MTRAEIIARITPIAARAAAAAGPARLEIAFPEADPAGIAEAIAEAILGGEIDRLEIEADLEPAEAEEAAIRAIAARTEAELEAEAAAEIAIAAGDPDPRIAH